jgi:hypothetical protein
VFTKQEEGVIMQEYSYYSERIKEKKGISEEEMQVQRKKSILVITHIV